MARSRKDFLVKSRSFRERSAADAGSPPQRDGVGRGYSHGAVCIRPVWLAIGMGTRILSLIDLLLGKKHAATA